MKFGILFTSQPNPDTEKYPYRAVHQRVVEDVIEADRLGYDYAWIAEHHASNKYGIMPDPFMLIANLATQTKQIKLGTAVMTLPLHNVLRLAEETALADILTDGRFMLGLGSGYRKYEFDAFDVNFDERRDIQGEGLPLLLDMLRTHKVDHRGKFFSHSVTGDYEIFPQSIQQPYPPAYVAAATERSIGLGAGLGLGLLLSTLSTIPEVGKQTKFYREQCAQTPNEYRVNPAFGDVDVARFVYVAESDEEARQESSEGIVRHIESFTQGQTSGYLGNVSATGKELYKKVEYDRLTESTILHGSVETVVAGIERLRDETGATSLMLHFPPYYGPERTREVLARFAEAVIPKFR